MTDASANELGCCILQEGRPAALAFRKLTYLEEQYVAIEKEMLEIVYTINKCHHFVYGKPIKVITDHNPNVSVFNKQISKINSMRLQRLRLKIIAYKIQEN